MVGNIPNFTKIDILRCFLRFKKNIGRQELSKELYLGEGTIRTILESLKSKKLIDSTKKGHFLSKRGNEILAQISENISMPKEISIENIYPNYKKAGILIKNASNLKHLPKLRDIAVKNGAEGALILKFDDKLFAPESDYQEDYKDLEKQFKLKNNDALVIAFSSKNNIAETGALSIAVELTDSLKKFLKEF